MTTGYTEADVEQWHDAVHALVQAWAPNSDTRQRVEPILARLKSAALEGAKVPELKCELRDTQLNLQVRTKQWADLFDARADEVAASKIQSLAAWKDSACAERDEARAERAVLRAKLEDFRAWIRDMATEHGGIGYPCSLMDDDFSAPPAETETDDEAHRRLDALGVPRFGRCPATNKRESLTLDERRELAPPAAKTK